MFFWKPAKFFGNLGVTSAMSVSNSVQWPLEGKGWLLVGWTTNWTMWYAMIATWYVMLAGYSEYKKLLHTNCQPFHTKYFIITIINQNHHHVWSSPISHPCLKKKNTIPAITNLLVDPLRLMRGCIFKPQTVTFFSRYCKMWLLR